MYTDILRKILLKTCELSELTEEQVKASREESARVARKILIEVLTTYFSDTEIAKFLCVKRQRVNAIRNERMRTRTTENDRRTTENDRRTTENDRRTTENDRKRPFTERILLRDLSIYTQQLLNEVETIAKQNKEP